MSEDNVVASLKGSPEKFQQIISNNFLSDSEPMYDRIYCYIGDGKLQLIGSISSSVFTHSTYENGYFDKVEGEGEAIFNSAELSQYLNLAVGTGGSDKFTFELEQDDDSDRFAKRCTMTGRLQSRIRLPRSEKILSQLYMDAPSWFEGDMMLNTGGNKCSTRVETDVETVQNLIEASEAVGEQESFPFVVKDERLIIDSNPGDGLSVSGDLCEASGPDVSNSYHDEFGRVFSTIAGDVTISTEEDFHLGIVQSGPTWTHRTAIGNNENI